MITCKLNNFKSVHYVYIRRIMGELHCLIRYFIQNCNGIYVSFLLTLHKSGDLVGLPVLLRLLTIGY